MSKQQDDIRFLRARPEVHFDDLPESQKKLLKKQYKIKQLNLRKAFIDMVMLSFIAEN